jgi:hypothetical protein
MEKQPDSASSVQVVHSDGAHGGQDSAQGGQEARVNGVITSPGSPFLRVHRRTMATSRGSCVICRGRQRSRINGLLADGWSANAIEAEMRRRGHPVKRETVARHRRRCLDDDPQTSLEVADIERRLDDGAYSSDKAMAKDLAIIVQRRAIRALQRGAMPVSVAQGLTAQRLIDRRLERQQQHAFMANLARLLSGAGLEPPDGVLLSDDIDEES